MVPSLRYLIIVEDLHRLYLGNIIYPLSIYPNRFIYLGGWVGWDIMLLFFQMFKLFVFDLIFFPFFFSLMYFSLMELMFSYILCGKGNVCEHYVKMH